jgi:hypothetical protein
MIILPKAIQKPRNVLPKTGQITSYQAGDDGQYEAGWWRRRLNANNKTRFVAKTIAGDNVICDYATRLMWKASDGPGGFAPWTLAIIAAEALVYAGFSDWKLPNVLELVSILNFGAIPSAYAIFNMSEDTYWTSTTFKIITMQAFCASFINPFVYPDDKTAEFYIRFCREF